ncbi:unnamed protein product, partial [Allacma fusca]
LLTDYYNPKVTKESLIAQVIAKDGISLRRIAESKASRRLFRPEVGQLPKISCNRTGDSQVGTYKVLTHDSLSNNSVFGGTKLLRRKESQSQTNCLPLQIR